MICRRAVSRDHFSLNLAFYYLRQLRYKHNKISLFETSCFNDLELYYDNIQRFCPWQYFNFSTSHWFILCLLQFTYLLTFLQVSKSFFAALECIDLQGELLSKCIDIYLPTDDSKIQVAVTKLIRRVSLCVSTVKCFCINGYYINNSCIQTNWIFVCYFSLYFAFYLMGLGSQG